MAYHCFYYMLLLMRVTQWPTWASSWDTFSLLSASWVVSSLTVVSRVCARSWAERTRVFCSWTCSWRLSWACLLLSDWFLSLSVSCVTFSHKTVECKPQWDKNYIIAFNFVQQKIILTTKKGWWGFSIGVPTCPCSAWFFSFSWLSKAVSPSPAWILAHRSSLSASSWVTMSLLFCSRASRFWIFWSLSPIWRSTCSRSFYSAHWTGTDMRLSMDLCFKLGKFKDHTTSHTRILQLPFWL